MKKKIKWISTTLTFITLMCCASLHAGEANSNTLNPQNIATLKQLMGKFGTYMAGVEILKTKEKNPDWASIDLTLNEMSQTLAKMQEIDTDQAYKTYTDMLAAGLSDLKSKSKKRDKNIYNSFDNLIQTCFQCHAMHRPVDALKPKGKLTAKTH